MCECGSRVWSVVLVVVLERQCRVCRVRCPRSGGRTSVGGLLSKFTRTRSNRTSTRLSHTGDTIIGSNNIVCIISTNNSMNAIHIVIGFGIV